MFRIIQTRACFRRGLLAKFVRQNTSHLLDFVATRHCQGNPRPSLITEIRLTCTAALKILHTERLICTTTYLYFAFKVRNLPSSAEAFQLASKLNSTILSNTKILRHIKAICCKVFSLLFIVFGGERCSLTSSLSNHRLVNIIGGRRFLSR